MFTVRTHGLGSLKVQAFSRKHRPKGFACSVLLNGGGAAQTQVARQSFAVVSFGRERTFANSLRALWQHH